jgi:hypothetical protein
LTENIYNKIKQETKIALYFTEEPHIIHSWVMKNMRDPERIRVKPKYENINHFKIMEQDSESKLKAFVNLYQ